MKKIIAKILYNTIATNLPNSERAIVGKISKGIRGYLFNIINDNHAKNINIQRKVSFSGKIKIGDNSGIGVNSSLNGKISIGENVMIGPELLAYSRNHKTSDINIPMICQGFDEEKEIVIEDDIWIGGRVILLRWHKNKKRFYCRSRSCSNKGI